MCPLNWKTKNITGCFKFVMHDLQSCAISKTSNFSSMNFTVGVYKIVLMVIPEMIEFFVFKICSKTNCSFLLCFRQISNFYNYKTKCNNTTTFLSCCSKWMAGIQCKRNHKKDYNSNNAKRNNTLQLITCTS